jgi:hypothetical protein
MGPLRHPPPRRLHRPAGRLSDGSGLALAILVLLLALWPGAGAAASLSYACTGGNNDVPTIQADIAAVAAQGGGTVTLTGACLVNQPINFQDGTTPYLNVWLKGAGPGATVLQRRDAQGNSAFLLDTPMLQASIGVPAGLPPGATALTAATNRNLQISDMTIDPGILAVTNTAVAALPAGALQIVLPNIGFSSTVQPNSGFAGGIGQCAPCGPVGLFDLTQPGSAGTAPAITLPAGGNVVAVTSDGVNTTLLLGLPVGNCTANTSAACCPPSASLAAPGQISSGTTACYCLPAAGSLPSSCYASPVNAALAAGDTLAVFAVAGVVDLEYIDGLSVNDITIINGGGIMLQNDAAFVISNSQFVTNDDLSTFTCDGGLFVGSNGPLGNLIGIVSNNVFTNSGMEIDASWTTVSGNSIKPTPCGGIDGALGVFDIFQANVIQNSLLASTYSAGKIPFNHDLLVNSAMQIWNDNAAIIDNVVAGNGGAGIQVGGSNSVVARNIVYDNGQSPYCNLGNGCSGIVIQGNSAEAASQISVSDNLSCNTTGSNPLIAQPACIAGPGSQLYALDISSDVASVSLTPDNRFTPATIGNLDGIAVATPAALPQATISASPCTLPTPDGVCSSTITWSSQNVAGVSIYVSNSSDPAVVQQFASGGGGLTLSQAAGWIQNRIYVFSVMDTQGSWLASVTLQPTIAGQ